MSTRQLRKQLAVFNAAHLGGPKPKVKKAKKKPIEKKNQESAEKTIEKNLQVMALLDHSRVASTKKQLAKAVRKQKA